ncbi:MAG: QueT transporter family protein [Clostridia bacterium]|nr:QueT transporter family protein [Clostridia bacterium]
MQKKTQFLTQSALIAALYVALTYVSAMLGIASGVVQVRLSEALTVLPAMTGAAVPGLFAGCLVANLLTGASLWDIVFGSLATLLGALGTRYLGRKCYWAPIFPILSNTLIIPFVLKIAYGVGEGYSFLFLTIFLGEFISCGILGVMLFKALEKTKIFR